MTWDIRTGDAPLCVELYCGTFGWSHGWMNRGGRAVGFDIEHLPHHGEVPERANLVLQDVRTLHGSQFKDAALILASPPCQEFSYRAMPWKRAREMPPPVLGMELFEACFRIQREASEAAGRHVPMVVENVCGAQKWVGRAAWHFGSFYLWGDVPALMPRPYRATKVPRFRFDGSGKSFQTASVEGVKAGDRCKDRATGKWTTGWNVQNVRDMKASLAYSFEGVKQGGDWFNAESDGISRRSGSKSTARKMASALIARIPERLSDWIAEVYFPGALLLNGEAL